MSLSLLLVHTGFSLILHPGLEILHELVLDGIHVEPTGADGDSGKGEATMSKRYS